MPSALRVRWAKFRVLSVSFVALVILMTLVYLLTGGTLLEKKARIYLYIPDATGLDQGSPVRVDGIGVGIVDWVALSGSSNPQRIIRVQMTVERGRLASITSDSQTQISNDTLIGDKFVDISTGKASGHIPENGELNFKAQPDLMRSIDLSDFERQLRLVNGILDEIEGGRTPLGQFVMGDQVYTSLRHRIIEVQNALKRATGATAQIGGILYTDALYQKFRAPVLELDQTLSRLQSGQGEMGRFLRDPAQYQQLRGMLQDMRKNIAAARSADLMKSDDAYRSWTASATSFLRKIDELNASPMLNGTDLYESWTGAAREMQNTVKDFRENPRKYLRLKVF
jgi:phospholipid/cholesterol/gamma-HCH transport system substrate-binding protein